MANKFIISFLFCIIGFIASEYFLLQEIYAEKRLPILIGTIFGVVSSLTLFLFLYKKFRKTVG